VNFSAQYPAKYNADMIAEGATLRRGGGSGPVFEVPAFRMDSHTSNAINLRADQDNATAHVEFKFSQVPQAVHPGRLLLFLEGFNLTQKIENEEMTIEVFLVDPFGIEPARTVAIQWKIIDYVRSFRAGQVGTDPPILQRSAIPPNAYPLEAAQPFMDMQTHEFTEVELKFRVDKVRITVPRLKTSVKLTGVTDSVEIYGGIRVHGVAINSVYKFGKSGQTPYFLPDGPWYTQAHQTYGDWTLSSVNSNLPATLETLFRDHGCWISAWASALHSMGATRVEAFESNDLVNLTPLTLARYAQKLGLFENGNMSIELHSSKMGFLLDKINRIPGNVTLKYNDQVKDVAKLEDYLARKIPVLLSVHDERHFVLAIGMNVHNYEGNWVKTYLIHDPGYLGNERLVSVDADLDWTNQFKYGLLAVPAARSIPSSLSIEIFSPAYAYIVDPLGRRMGLNPDDGILYEEIPMVTEALGQPSATILPTLGTPPDPDPVKYIHINQPVDGEYRIQVVGTGTGHYTMKTTRMNIFGHWTDQTVSGTTVPGKVDAYTLNYTGWNRINPLSIRFTATDDASGVAQTLVSLDDGEPQSLNPLLIGEEGVHQVEYWSLDAAGNVEPSHSLTIRNDFSAPVSSHNYTGTGMESGPISIAFQASDALSGVAQSYLTVNGIARADFGPLALTDPGNYEIAYHSVDAAGNVEEDKGLDISIQAGGPPIPHLKAKAKGTEVSLKWKDIGAQEYSILRSTQGPSTGFVEIARVSDRKFEDSGLNVGVTYFYKVTAGGGESEVVSAVVPGGQ
jgi:hypothetical protein